MRIMERSKVVWLYENRITFQLQRAEVVNLTTF